MILKERLLKELDGLSQSEILRVYELVQTIKEQEKRVEKSSKDGYMRARQALKSCSGSFSDDIREERNERI